MKKLIVLTLILSGCQLTIQRLPAPVDPDVAKIVANHDEALKVLADDYNKRQEKK